MKYVNADVCSIVSLRPLLHDDNTDGRCYWSWLNSSPLPNILIRRQAQMHKHFSVCLERREDRYKWQLPGWQCTSQSWLAEALLDLAPHVRSSEASQTCILWNYPTSQSGNRDWVRGSHPVPVTIPTVWFGEISPPSKSQNGNKDWVRGSHPVPIPILTFVEGEIPSNDVVGMEIGTGYGLRMSALGMRSRVELLYEGHSE